MSQIAIGVAMGIMGQDSTVNNSNATQNPTASNSTESLPASAINPLLRRYHADMGVDSSAQSATVGPRLPDTKWEAHESQRQRELEEARARASQMEKTMKWWSDCTANWREKWSKVRNERNKMREENKQLRANLDLAMKESSSYKREKNDLEIQVSQLKKEMDKVHTNMMKHDGQFNKVGIGDNTEEEESVRHLSASSEGRRNAINNEDKLVNNAAKDLSIEEITLNSKNDLENDDMAGLEKRLIQHEYLDDTQKIIQAEREEKASLLKKLEKLTLETAEAHELHEEMRCAKQEAVRELLTLQEQHRAELRILNNTLQEEVNARSNLDRRLGELRIELERLQSENALEWEKRERLETEKLSLERDNKKLRSELTDLQERSNRQNRHMPTTNNALQLELDKNKEISELKMAHTKLKKLLAETNTELDHAQRRAEQYEAEVKRLRQRVEELKRDLAGAEDELDSALNIVRRLQRDNKELVDQNENLQIQIQHAQNSQSYRNSSNGGVQMRSKVSAELPSECLPNINDLRQLFDYAADNNVAMDNLTRRASYSECSVSITGPVSTTTSTHLVSANYDNNKSNCQKDEQLIELKGRNLEFERAKKKFDNPSHLLLQHNHQLQQQRQQQQRTSRERTTARFGANKNGIHLALPLKNLATSGATKSGHARSVDLQTGVSAADAVVDIAPMITNVVESAALR